MVNITNAKRSGLFYLDAADVATVDDGAITLVTTDGKRYKRDIQGFVDVRWYGATGDGTTNDQAAIQSALNSGFSVFFPNGTYLVSTVLTYTGTNRKLFGNGNAILRTATVNTVVLKLAGCENVEVTGLRFEGSAVGSGQIGLWFNTSRLCSIHNNRFSTLNIGLYADQTASPAYAASTINDNQFRDLNTGVHLTGSAEYINITNNQVYSALVKGIYVNTGNVKVSGNTVMDCFVGIEIEGDNGGANNTDHGSVIGNTVNHSIMAGIVVKNTTYGQLVADNLVWATLGPNAVNADYDLTGTTVGIYLKNVENVQVMNNQIGHNRIGLAYNGMIYSQIVGNSFIANATFTTSHIRETGAAHTVTGINAQDIIDLNQFAGSYVTGTVDQRPVQVTSTANSAISIRGNFGNFLRYRVLTGATAAYDWTGEVEHLIVKSDYTGMLTINPARKQVAFTLVYQQLAAGVNKTITLSSGVGISLSPGATISTNTVTINRSGAFTFTPNDADGWLITGPGYIDSDINTLSDARITLQKGAANGVATTDANIRLPHSQLPTPVSVAVTGLTYTLVATDCYKTLLCANAATQTITIPASLLLAGCPVNVVREGGGTVTFAAGAGLTLNSAGGFLSITTQWGMATVLFRSTTTAVLGGNIN